MSMQSLKIARAVGFILFAVASLVVVHYQPGSFLALLVPAVPLFVAVGFGFVINHRNGSTIAKRAEWFQNTFGRTGDDKNR